MPRALQTLPARPNATRQASVTRFVLLSVRHLKLHLGTRHPTDGPMGTEDAPGSANTASTPERNQVSPLPCFVLRSSSCTPGTWASGTPQMAPWELRTPQALLTPAPQSASRQASSHASCCCLPGARSCKLHNGHLGKQHPTDGSMGTEDAPGSANTASKPELNQVTLC